MARHGGRLLPRSREKAADRAGTDGDQVTWAADKAPGLRVLHRRTGPRYRAETPSESWYLRLNDGQRERIVNVDSGRLKPLAADLTPGVRLGNLAGLRPRNVRD